MSVHQSALSHTYFVILTQMLSDSLVDDSPCMYINPRIVALRIQLVLLPSSPCAQCKLSSGP